MHPSFTESGDELAQGSQIASEPLYALNVAYRAHVGDSHDFFGVSNEKLLGYIVSERGIEANPKNITAISNIGPIRNVKGVQRLTGYLAALSPFISWLGEWGMPLYKILKKTDAFV